MFIKANLKTTISYFIGSQEVVIPVDSIISVNVQDGYAVWHNIHFEIFPDEYCLTT